MYKNFDPRAKIIREISEEVFQITGRDPLIDVAIELEKVPPSFAPFSPVPSVRPLSFTCYPTPYAACCKMPVLVAATGVLRLRN